MPTYSYSDHSNKCPASCLDPLSYLYRGHIQEREIQLLAQGFSVISLHPSLTSAC